MDVACLFDTRIVKKEREKVDRYELKYELKRICSCSEKTVIPAVINALGTILKDFHSINGLIRSILTSTLEPYKRTHSKTNETEPHNRTARYALNI